MDIKGDIWHSQRGPAYCKRKSSKVRRFKESKMEDAYWLLASIWQTFIVMAKTRSLKYSIIVF